VNIEFANQVMAHAGTGKSYMLRRYALERPHMRFLYVAYNKAVAEEARLSFPDNVVCKYKP
jgi:F-box protein 18 (helicase)